MQDPYRRQCRPALGTFVEIALRAEVADDAVFDAAYASIAAVERQMSFHDPDSILSRINRAVPGELVVLPALTQTVVRAALAVHAATGGLFDCGVGHELVRRGLLPDAGARSTGGLAAVQLVDDCLIVHAAVCLDLGGIAKGFAVDQAIETIVAAGVPSCIVNAGGDLRVTGPHPAPVAVRDPSAPGSLVPFGEMLDGAVATSAPYYSRQGEGLEASCALFDPAGVALIAPRSYTVIAPTCMIADALTKAVAVALHRQAQPHASGVVAFHADFLAGFAARAFIL